jgi:uncharacterized surface protein with fasciclin (FAS1) repeats
MKALMTSLTVALSLSLGSLDVHACGSKDKSTESAKACSSKDSIVAVATQSGSFTTLLTALKAAGLEDVLKGEGPFTVFAPTDEAFSKLPAGTVDALLKDPAKLKQVLLFHVVAGKVMAAEVVKLDSAKTAQGLQVAVKVDGSEVRVGSAKVVKADVAAANGVIHVIDTVLIPAV